MTAKRKMPNFWQKIIHTIVATLNLNTLLIAIVGGYFAMKGNKMDTKQDTIISNQDTVIQKQQTTQTFDSTYRKRNDARWLRIDSNFAVQNRKLDSLLNKN